MIIFPIIKKRIYLFIRPTYEINISLVYNDWFLIFL